MRAAGEETQCYRIVGRGWGVETSLRRYLAKALRHRGNHSTIWGAAFQAEGAASAKALWRAHGVFKDDGGSSVAKAPRMRKGGVGRSREAGRSGLGGPWGHFGVDPE